MGLILVVVPIIVLGLLGVLFALHDKNISNKDG